MRDVVVKANHSVSKDALPEEPAEKSHRLATIPGANYSADARKLSVGRLFVLHSTHTITPGKERSLRDGTVPTAR